MVDEENWVAIIPFDGSEPLTNIGYRHHFELLEEIAPELKKEINYWAIGMQNPISSERILACGHVDHLNKIHFKECPGDRNSVYAIMMDKVNAPFKFGKTSPFFEADNILNLFVARAMNEHIPDEQDISEVAKYSKNLVGCSISQKRDCLIGIMEAENPAAAIRLAQDTKCLEFLLPEVADTKGFWQRYKNSTTELFQHIMTTLDYVAKHSKDPILKWAALLHDIGKPKSVWVDKDGRTRFNKGPEGQGEDHERVGAEIAKEILERLEMPEDYCRQVPLIVLNHMFDTFFDSEGAEDFIETVGGIDRAYDMLTLRAGDDQGKRKQEEKEARVEKMRKLLDKVNKKGDWEEISDKKMIIILRESDII